MRRSIPDAEVLLQAAAEYLQNELLPTLSGYHAFQTRVTVNVLNTVRRELEHGETMDQDERARLVKLLKRDGTLEELNDMLVAQIGNRQMALDDAELRQHIRRSLEEALSVNNPKWLSR
ncbi:MAG: DUF6285 domain-containing protein [Rhodospirillales bacterium]